VRTHLSPVPVPEMVKELLLAHANPGLRGVYDQWAYSVGGWSCGERG